MSRNLRIVYMPWQHLETLLDKPIAHDVLQVAVRDGVPEGTRVLGVHTFPERMSFGILLEHPTFDPVPDGQMIPEHDDRMTLAMRGFLIVTDHLISEYTSRPALETLKAAIERRLEQLK